jgi:hypothetical protein
MNKININDDDTNVKNDKQDNMNLIPDKDIDLVKNSLEYFDKNKDKYESKFKNVKYISTKTSDIDTEQTVKYFYDASFNLLFKSRCEYIGLFDIEYGLWSWAWSIIFLKKKDTAIIRKILNFGTELEPESTFLKTELVLSRFKITNKIQIDIHLAIVSYLAKKPIIFCQKYSQNIIDNKYIDVNDPSATSSVYIFLLDEI